MSLLLILTLFAEVWVETTQQDFADGWFSRDLYSSHRGDGTVEFVGRFDLNNDGYIDIPGDNWIMWGSNCGFSISNTASGFVGEGGCDAGDLNIDGYSDFITSQVKGNGIRIFCGSDSGPDAENSTLIPVSNVNNEGVFTADFNKDGHLDILASVDDNNAAVFWGSYPYSTYTSLPCHKMGYNPEAADLNRDGWLDAIVTSGDTEDEFIYWGGPQGFSANTRTHIIYVRNGFHSPHGMSVADLNYDGWLDLVYAPHWGPDEAAILWGNEKIYCSSEYELNFFLPLPNGDGRGYGGSSVADLNNDGYLDIVFFCNDDVPNRIFWGDPRGISRNRYQDLYPMVHIATGGMVADFNQDRHLDIFAYDWYGDYPTFIYYGPDFVTYDSLTIGSHHGLAREIGNVYTREYREEYYSSVLDAEMDIGYLEVSWSDSCPGSSRISIAVRSGEKMDTTNTWGQWLTLKNGEHIDVSSIYQSTHRYIQYKVIFEYFNPAELPVLEEVRIRYEETEQVVEDLTESGGPKLEVILDPTLSLWNIRFVNVESRFVDIGIYDIKGSRVKTLIREICRPGEFEFVWDGCNEKGFKLSNGIYFVNLVTPCGRKTSKIVIKE